MYELHKINGKIIFRNYPFQLPFRAYAFLIVYANGFNYDFIFRSICQNTVMSHIFVMKCLHLYICTNVFLSLTWNNFSQHISFNMEICKVFLHHEKE